MTSKGSRESRKAAEKRRLARRRAEARGALAPDWATARDGSAPLLPQQMGLVAVTALALARQAEQPPPPPSVKTERPPARRPAYVPSPAEARRDARERRESAQQTKAALRSVLARRCPRHDAEPGAACWTTPLGGPGVCGERIRSAGFRGQVNARSKYERSKS